VEQVHGFFDKCHANLTMVWQTMFPLDPDTLTLLASMAKFKNYARVQTLVRKQLLAGVKLAFAFVLAHYWTLDLELISMTGVELRQYYPAASRLASIIVVRMDAGTEADLRTRTNQGA
jgi:hypothetical protein